MRDARLDTQEWAGMRLVEKLECKCDCGLPFSLAKHFIKLVVIESVAITILPCFSSPVQTPTG
jgi:hypothetical protein